MCVCVCIDTWCITAEREISTRGGGGVVLWLFQNYKPLIKYCYVIDDRSL